MPAPGGRRRNDAGGVGAGRCRTARHAVAIATDRRGWMERVHAIA